MKKKGFTLIELLAVIVILAIIALIATPIVMNVIESARKGAAERSAENYLKAVEIAIMEEKLNNNKQFNPSLCIVENNTTANCDGILLTLDIKVKEINSGYIKLQDGKVTNYNVIVEGKEITTEEVIITESDETPKECFTYIDNYEYTINKDACMNVFGTTADDMLGTGAGELICSGDKTYGDVINLVHAIGYSKDQLEEYGVISDIKEKGTLSIVGYTCGGENGTHKDVVVPKEIEGKKVTVIGQSAFNTDENLGAFKEKTRINSIVIQDIVTTIEYNAFYNNQLTSVVIPNSVTTIGKGAFASNQLTSVVIPNSVKSIGAGAFNYNQLLTSVMIENTIGNVLLGDNAFGNFDENKIEWVGNN